MLSTGYHKRLIENLPQLQILDGLDREGMTAVVDEILADIPGLDQYLEYLVSRSSSVSLRKITYEFTCDQGIVVAMISVQY